jgi:hypothetical protein
MHVQRIAKIGGMHGRVADLAEARTMARAGCEPRPAMMPAADMRMTEAMPTEMTTTEMTASVMSTAVTAAMATTMTTATTVTTAAFRQGCACQHASQGQCGNSNDWSQHPRLP